VLTVDDAPPLDFKRDRWQRPLIVPKGGGKAKPYTRSSSAAKTVEDHWNLEMWARRGVAYGMAHDSSLVARVLAIGGDPGSWNQAQKNAVNVIHEDAQKVAQSHKAADIGTAVHNLTEQLDRGEIVHAGPYEADLQAYVNALIAAGLSCRPEWVECRMVCDELEMAGTADRIVTAEGCVSRIADLKTGGSVDYGGLGWAAQLASYANGELYDVETDQRIWTPDLDLEVGYIIHLPAGQGVCTIYEIDLLAGYRAAQLANEIRAIRKASKTWISPLVVEAPPAASTDDASGPSPAADPAGDPFDGLEPLAPTHVGIKANAQACRSCKAPIIWATSVKGKPIPLDYEPTSGGNLVLVDGVARSPQLGDEEPFLQYISHFATCPDAEQHRGHPRQKPVTLADLDQGAPIPDADFDPLRKVTATLDAAAQSWLKGVITDAGGKGVAIKGQLHARSFDLLRGLVTLARRGHGEDELARELAATALKADDPFHVPTVGQAVGILDAAQASRFAALCVALCDDVTSVELRQRPAAA
jgi:hypothetical protein